MGGLIGLLFLNPLLGMAIGGAAGAAAGAASDFGVDDNFLKELGEKLQPGNAAVLVLVRESTRDKVLPAISQHGGHVIQTSLSNGAGGRPSGGARQGRRCAGLAPERIHEGLPTGHQRAHCARVSDVG